MNLYFYLRHFPARGDVINDGLKKAVHGLCSGLASHGVNVSIVCESSTSESSIFLSTAGYTIYCFPNPIQSRPSFRLSPSLQEFIKNNTFQNSLFILNGILHPSLYSVSRLLKGKNIPYIIAPHDVYHPIMFQKNLHLKIPYWFLLEKYTLLNAKAIQFLDIYQSKFLRDRGIKSYFFEVANGCFNEDFFHKDKLTWSSGEKPSLFYFGRIDSYHKGLDLLVSAFSDFTNSVDSTLTLQGPDGGSREKLQRQVSLNHLENKVNFLDSEYKKPPSLVISNYDIFCMPSRFEGFGLSALEAMIAGRVLLVSEESGIARHVRASGCGEVVAPEVSAITSGLLRLYQRRSDWKQMGLAGRSYALKNLQWNQLARQATHHYSQLISNTSSH